MRLDTRCEPARRPVAAPHPGRAVFEAELAALRAVLVREADDLFADGGSAHGDRARYVAARDAYKDCEARARAVLGCGL